MKALRVVSQFSRNPKVWILVLCLLFTLYWRNMFYRRQPAAIRIQDYLDDTMHRSFIKNDYLNPQGRVIYNRVGKCGSRTLVGLLKELALQNNFKLIGTMINNQVAMSTKDQMDFVNFIEKLNPPFIYHQHIHYVEFERFGGIQPVHINMIRDPIERTVSQYYFRRFGDERQADRNFHGSPKTRNETFDECLARGRMECTGPNTLFYIIPFFCGQKPMCREHGRRALDHAKNNVRSKYLVVGVLEDFESFLLVLETLLPQQFKGITELWKNPEPTMLSKLTATQTRNKKPPSEKTRSILRKKLALEYEFYDFVKENFRTLKNELNITRSKTLTSKPHLPWNSNVEEIENDDNDDDNDAFENL